MAAGGQRRASQGERQHPCAPGPAGYGNLSMSQSMSQ